MKKLVLILLVFVSVGAFAQVRKDTIGSVFIIRDAPPAKSNPLYVVDGETSSARPKLKPKEIIYIEVLNALEAIKFYGKKANDGAILIITKELGTELYQNKFSRFSDEYRLYLVSHKGDDSRLVYFLSSDGSALTGDKIDDQRKLFEIKAADIESINFAKESENATGIKPAIVRINIKLKTKI
ncbi:MAG: hypothetical protein V4520_07250 [Bacteroidota bacterium]